MEKMNDIHHHIGHIISGENINVGDLNYCELSISDQINHKTDDLIKRDKTTNNFHFYLFDSKRTIENAHEDGNYDIMLSYYGDSSISKDRRDNISTCLDILYDCNILLITGNYGQGKTMLSKALQLQCINKGDSTVFFRAQELIRVVSDFKLLSDIFINMLAKKKTQRLIIFIDSIDELNYGNSIKELLDSIFICIKSNRSIYFVINSRVYIKIQQQNNTKKIEDIFHEEIFDILEIAEFLYVKMKNLDNKLLNNLFFNLNSTDEYEKSLKTQYIKEHYKHMLDTCKIPLFAYVIGDYYYNHNFNLPNTISDIYNSFITKTIKGKFSQECSNHPRIKDHEFEYHNLLKLLAISMINKTSHYLNYSNIEEFFSENIKYSFYIELSKLSYETEKIYNNITQFKGYYEDKDNINADFLNCYFFKVCETDEGKFFSFSDENTMCYLAAEYVFDILAPLLKQNEINNKVCEPIINSLDQFFPNPLAMDFLIERINSVVISNDTKRNNIIKNISKILNYMKNYYSKEKYYQKETNENVPSIKGIMAQIILMVIFIKFNQKSYKNIDSNHFFKHFYLLNQVAKAMELNGQHSLDLNHHRYLIERYFSDCIIIDAYFRRLNLKYFDFNKSEMTNCVFYQCKFFESNFCDTKFKGNTKFDLCEFNSVNFSPKILDNIVFQDSKIINCKFIDVCSDIIILFDNCRIANLEFAKNIFNRRVRVIFRNCNFQNISINECKASIGIYGCLFPNNEKIKIKGNANVTLISNSNISEIQCDSDYKLADENFYECENKKGIDWHSYQ